MSLIRRSMLPSFLFSEPPPKKAPSDPQVQLWLRMELQTTKHAKPVKALARLMEKALDRKPGKLDLSSADPMALHKMSPALIGRLTAHLATLVLPDGCPQDVGLHWAKELPNVEITPRDSVPPRYRFPPGKPSPPPRTEGTHLKREPAPARPALDRPAEKLAFIHRGRGVFLPPRPANPVHAPRVPETSVDLGDLPPPSDLSSDEVLEEAVRAMRPLNAWLLHHASSEGNEGMTAMGTEDALAISRALLREPQGLSRVEQRAFSTGKAALAARGAGQSLRLNAVQVEALCTAVATLQNREAAEAYKIARFGNTHDDLTRYERSPGR